MSQIQDLQELVATFQIARGWTNFNPENVSRALSIESLELQELFLWQDGSESQKFTKQNKETVSNEVADVFAYLLTFCRIADIDLEKALKNKMKINEKRFPKI